MPESCLLPKIQPRRAWLSLRLLLWSVSSLLHFLLRCLCLPCAGLVPEWWRQTRGLILHCPSMQTALSTVLVLTRPRAGPAPLPSSFPKSPSHASISPSSRNGTSRCSKLRGSPPQRWIRPESQKFFPSPPNKTYIPWTFHLQGCLTATHPNHSSVKKRILLHFKLAFGWDLWALQRSWG